ncbi:MAG: DNA-binding protein, partial [Lyngbya sp.]|nr:DNA-binding protein [Lyngbya sp.]MEB3283649.1 DNA-binding protein [Lyngbya sp.]
MIVGTTEAAQILKISTARLRVLLSEGRVEGAYKTGKMWL